MRTTLWTLLLCMTMVTAGFAATITVAQDGSGDVPSVQAAAATAANGDEIVILDSAVYEEDLTAGAGAGFAAQFTLKAAEGQTPTLRAVNTAIRLDAFDIPDEDRLGTILFGCVGTVIEGIIFENLTTQVNASTISSALGLIDCIDVTIRNCTIRGAGGPGTSYDAFNFGTVVFGVTLAPTGIVYENCLVEECHFGVQVLKATAGVPTDPSITLRGCTIQNCNGNGIEMDCAATPNPEDPSVVATGPGHLIEDTVIVNCANPATLGGGKITFRRCDFLGNRGYVNVDKQDTGELPILAGFDDVAIIGSGNIGVRVIGGILTMTNCIVAGCAREGLYLTEDAEEGIATVDHCDFYQNLTETPDSFQLRLDPATGLDRTLAVSNTNVLGISGIINGKPDAMDVFDPDVVTASYCNVNTEFDPYINVTVDHEVSFDPQYVNPTTDPDLFTREGFQLQEGSPALTAASDGGPLGSQGPADVRVTDWAIH